MKLKLFLVGFLWMNSALCQTSAALPCVGEASTACMQSDDVARIASGSINAATASSSGFQIDAGADGTNATLKLAKTVRQAFRLTRGGVEELEGFRESSSIALQTPTAKGGTATTLATLDGLTSATTVELKWLRARTIGIRPGNLNAKEAACAKFVPYFNDAKKQGKFSGVKELECDLGMVKELLGDTEEFRKYKALYFAPDAHTLTWAVSLRAGYEDFTFYDPISLVKTKARKAPRSAGIGVSYHAPDYDALVTASFRVQEAFKDATSSTRCPSAAASAPTICVSGPFGAPATKRTEIIGLDLKRLIAPNIALGASLNRDFKNKLTGIELPIYVLASAKGGLTGGIKFGWTSDEKKVSASLFIGQPFALF